MNVLEKILEEIEEATFQEDAPIYIGKVTFSSCETYGDYEIEYTAIYPL